MQKKQMITIFLAVLVVFSFCIQSQAEEGSSFAKTVRTLQDSFEMTMEENAFLRDSNKRMETEIEFLKSELARLEAVSRDSITDLEAKYGNAIKEIDALREENDRLQARRTSYDPGYSEGSYSQRLKAFQSRKYGGNHGTDYAVKSKRMPDTKERQKKQDPRRSGMMMEQRERQIPRQESGVMHYNLGNLYFRNGDYEKAAYEYQYALRIMPNDPDAIYNLAILYDFHLNKGKEAQALYIKFLRANPDSELVDFIKERIATTTLRGQVGN